MKQRHTANFNVAKKDVRTNTRTAFGKITAIAAMLAAGEMHIIQRIALVTSRKLVSQETRQYTVL